MLDNSEEFDDSEMSLMTNFYWIIVSQSQLKLEIKISIWFTAGDCDRDKDVVVNEFDTKAMRWIGNKIFVKKFYNYNNCSLTVGIYNQEPLHGVQVIRNSTSAVALNPHGVNVDLLMVAMVKYNLTINFVRAEFSGADFYLTNDNEHSLSKWLTSRYWSENVFILLPPGELYTPLEKMILPFDKATWICFYIHNDVWIYSDSDA